MEKLVYGCGKAWKTQRIFFSHFVVVTLVFTAQCYASTVLAMALCLSVRLSQIGVLVKRLNESSWFWHVSFLPPVLHCVKRKFGNLQK